MTADPLNRFSKRVADYVRYRPTYPRAFYDLLRNQFHIGPKGPPIADIGSGPGISAKPLLEMGVLGVYCVEPNRAMREAAEALLGGFAGFRSVDGTAEETTLPDGSVGMILCAQAFHWFDKEKARAEFKRILHPTTGAVVVVWNERRLDATPLLREYEDLLTRFATDYQQIRHENVDAAALSAFFGPAGYAKFEFENAQEFDYEGLEGRLRSSSYTPPAGDPRFEPMVRELRAIFDRHNVGGRVRFEYDTRAYIGPIS